MSKHERQKTWRDRRVAFIVSNSHHVITPVSVKMPVRVRERTDTKTIYEGPIAAKWLQIKEWPELNQLSKFGDFEYADTVDLVGVLFASDDMLEQGRIDWLVQSDTDVVEVGADRISKREDA